MSRFAGLLGIIVFLSIAYLFSTDRRAIRLKTVLWGLGLQFLFAWIVVSYSWGHAVMSAAGDKVKKLLAYSFVGSSFVFGDLGSNASHLDGRVIQGLKTGPFVLLQLDATAYPGHSGSPL